MKSDSDSRWMKKALSVARRGQGNTQENPSVGCIIVSKTNNLVGVGCTAKGGRPHAEITALTMAGDAAKGATAYVTLEPCAHHGKSPPCAEALIKTGITRVVVSAKDPNPRVNGKGLQILIDAGVEVKTGVEEKAANDLHAGFFSRITSGRPHVTLKLAVSKDGKIAAKNGEQTQITGSSFKSYVHLLRARADAILIGAGTAKIDNPQLTCRLPGMADRSPQIVVVGGSADLGLPENALHIPGAVEFSDLLQKLGRMGINNLLVEGGAKVAASLLRANMVDEVIIATAQKIIGAQGVDAFFDLPLSFVTASDNFSCQSTRSIGKDVIKRYKHVKGKS